MARTAERDPFPVSPEVGIGVGTGWAIGANFYFST
jgi:hypothetical protein